MIYNGDCLEVMKDIPDGSVDLVLTDPPYDGMTACKWDGVGLLSLDKVWEHLKRITKDNAAIVMFAEQPFTTKLISSNTEWFKYCSIWQKNYSTCFLLCKKQPLRRYEDICVFYKKQCTYNPQMVRGKIHTTNFGTPVKKMGVYLSKGGKNARKSSGEWRYPTNILEFKGVRNSKRLHSTQKPVDLLSYLIRTYSNEGETVLDFTMGSGSTGCACLETKREFIGIELDDTYFKVAKDRLDNYQRRVDIFEEI